MSEPIGGAQRIDTSVPRPAEPPSEAEILRRWDPSACAPLVSVLCHCFNQQAYIRDALNGILSQLTSFPFEVIVHDDASTDGTRAVIEEFAQRYPVIIRPILQQQNQFSLNNRPSLFTFPQIRGDWVAYCEGDDFWSSKEKLQMQLDAVCVQANVSICFHPAHELNSRTGSVALISDCGSKEQLISPGAVLRHRGDFMPTASLLCRRADLLKIHLLLSHAPIGDFFIQSYLALCGDVLYVPRACSVYRKYTDGSWTSRMLKPAAWESHLLGMVNSIDELFVFIRGKPGSWWLARHLGFYINKYAVRSRGLQERVSRVVRLARNVHNVPAALLLSGLLFDALEKAARRIRPAAQART